MYQRFIAVGRIGKPPEIRSTQSGHRIATFSLATSEYIKGEEKTEWHNVVVFNEKLVEAIQRRGQKGALVALEGQVQTRKWTDKEGATRYTTEIVLGAFNSRLQILSGGAEKGDAAEPAAKRAPADLDDEIPF